MPIMYSPFFLVLIISIFAFLFKRTFEDKGKKGLSLIIAGALFQLLLTSILSIPFIPLGILTRNVSLWVSFFITSISLIFILIGVLKMLFDVLRS